MAADKPVRSIFPLLIEFTYISNRHWPNVPDFRFIQAKVRSEAKTDQSVFSPPNCQYIIQQIGQEN